MKDTNGVVVQSVLRALDILCLFQKSEELGVSEIARLMGWGKSTTYGLINSLVSRGFLEQSSATKKYRLGIRNFELGRYVQQRMDLRGEAAPIIKEALSSYHETVHLATHYQGEVVHIESYLVPDVTALYTQAGRRTPMHCSGVGKAMLAFLPQQYLDQYIFQRPLKALTPYTITAPQVLLQDLLASRQRGYAIDDQELEQGLRCVAAPIFDFQKQPVAAISICGPVYRMDSQRMQEIAQGVIRCAHMISQRLGYHE